MNSSLTIIAVTPTYMSSTFSTDLGKIKSAAEILRADSSS
jgi:hypothetical protein